MSKIHLLIIVLVNCFSLLGQPVVADWEHRPWQAAWIAPAEGSPTEFGFYEFRREFDLDGEPPKATVLVSADNNYELIVNGRPVGTGPVLGDLDHYRYETYDIAGLLLEGRNHIVARVRNLGIGRPWNLQSYRTAFLLQAVEPELAALNTDGKWETRRDERYAPIRTAGARLGTYIVIGPQLSVDYRAGYGDWLPAQIVTRANPRGVGTEFYWSLVSRALPLPERRPLTPVLRRKQGDTLLYDLGRVTNFHYAIPAGGDRDAVVRVEVAESLFDRHGGKGHRDSIREKTMVGIYDEFVLDGTERLLSVPELRSGRYLEVTTGGGGAGLGALRVTEWRYPLERTYGMKAPEASLPIDDIVRVGMNTARACMLDTYVDCPYYERLQYVGDTRIQALVGYYGYRDDRLARKAIEVFDQSRLSDGLTMSRYPAAIGQVIPPYSLAWVEMVEDYRMHRLDSAFVCARMNGIEAVLGWYEKQLLPNGLVGPTPFWNFVDWAEEWPWDSGLRIGGVPPLEGGSSIISLQYAKALGAAAGAVAHCGREELATAYRRRRDAILSAVRNHCFDANRGLYADTPARSSFSQHANLLVVLTDVDSSRNHDLMRRVLEDTALIATTSYFDFYKVEALRHAGMMDRYPELLQNWADYLALGFTTWPEKPGKTRSDCHAWSASPNYHLGSALAGIRPASPGFATVDIQPLASPGFNYEVSVPHPLGTIRMIHQTGTYSIHLPKGLTGTLRLGGARHPLSAATNAREYRLR